MLSANFDAHLISPDIYFLILNRKIGMPFSKLQTTLTVKLFKEGSLLGYLMVIAKSFEGLFKGDRVNIKLKVSDDR